MKRLPIPLTLILTISAVQPIKTNSQGQDFYEDLYYLCNGERVSVRCSVDDKSDKAYCMASYPDRPKPRSVTVTQSTTRGEVRKLFATCKPPSAEDIEAGKRYDQMTIDYQNRAVQEQRDYVAKMQARMRTQTTDPGTLEMRRCVAAGREPMQCLGEVFTTGFKQMAGGGAGMGSLFGKDLPPGLRMTGRYGDGHFFIGFSEDVVWITCDGGSYRADYKVGSRNGQLAVVTTPDRGAAMLGNKPLALTFTPNGELAGAGVTDVVSAPPEQGQTTANSQTVRRYMSEEEAKNAPYWEHPQRDVGGNLYVDEPLSPPQPTMHNLKATKCTLGTNRALGSTGPTHATHSLAIAGGSNISGIFGGAPYANRSQKEKAWPGPGLRLHGTWDGPEGVSLEFHEDSVIVGCQNALLASPYVIQYQGTQSNVSIENNGNPVVLTFGPNLSLIGSGSIRVVGHAFVGDQPGHQTGSMFASATAMCRLGTLTARR